MTNQSVLSADLVAAALRAPAGCPPIERLAAAASSRDPNAELSQTELASLLRHADSCPSCAAELDLARSFDADLPGSSSAEGVDLAWVVERLRAGSSPRSERPLARVVSIASRRPATDSWRGWAALAATLAAIGIGLALSLPQREPAVGSLVGDDVVRGGRIELETALGTLTEAPARIAWRPVAGAVRYRLEIVGVDDGVVVGLDAATPSVELPAAERARLETFVRYRVRVSAFDASEARIALSAPLALSLEPARR